MFSNNKDQKKKWSDLSTSARAGTILMGIIQVALLVAALNDIRKRSDAEINGSKKVWIPFLFVNWIGPISYFIKGRKALPAEAESIEA